MMSTAGSVSPAALFDHCSNVCSQSVKMSPEQVAFAADQAIGDFIGTHGQKAADALGLTKPKMEPRHLQIFDFDRFSNTHRKLHDLRRDREELLREAKLLQTPSNFRRTDGTLEVRVGDTSILITKEQALAGIERRLLDTEERLATALYLMRDFIFEALGKLDYRPPIEAEA